MPTTTTAEESRALAQLTRDREAFLAIRDFMDSLPASMQENPYVRATRLTCTRHVQEIIAATAPEKPLPTLQEVMATLRENQAMLQDRYGLTILGVFGSMVRNEAGHESDVDVLVELDGRSLGLTYFGLDHILSELVGRKVDISVKERLKEGIAENVMAELVPL